MMTRTMLAVSAVAVLAGCGGGDPDADGCAGGCPEGDVCEAGACVAEAPPCWIVDRRPEVAFACRCQTYRCESTCEDRWPPNGACDAPPGCMHPDAPTPEQEASWTVDDHGPPCTGHYDLECCSTCQPCQECPADKRQGNGCFVDGALVECAAEPPSECA